jgi:hypothetical protein
MTNEKEYLPKIATPFYAHPDNQDFIAVGAPAKWAKEEEMK